MTLKEAERSVSDIPKWKETKRTKLEKVLTISLQEVKEVIAKERKAEKNVNNVPEWKDNRKKTREKKKLATAKKSKRERQ